MFPERFVSENRIVLKIRRTVLAGLSKRAKCVSRTVPFSSAAAAAGEAVKVNFKGYDAAGH